MAKSELKLKWRVDQPPTGRYRTFMKRGWPEAEANGRPVAWLDAERSYEPRHAEDTELTVRVRNWSDPLAPMKTLKARPVGVKAAKALVARFFEAHPEWLKII